MDTGQRLNKRLNYLIGRRRKVRFRLDIFFTYHDSWKAARLTTHRMSTSFLVSGLRSEYSSPPRSTLAGSSVNHSEQHTSHTAAISSIQRSSPKGRAWDRAALGYAVGMERVFCNFLHLASQMHAPLVYRLSMCRVEARKLAFSWRAKNYNGWRSRGVHKS